MTTYKIKIHCCRTLHHSIWIQKCATYFNEIYSMSLNYSFKVNLNVLIYSMNMLSISITIYHIFGQKTKLLNFNFLSAPTSHKIILWNKIKSNFQNFLIWQSSTTLHYKEVFQTSIKFKSFFWIRIFRYSYSWTI